MGLKELFSGADDFKAEVSGNHTIVLVGGGGGGGGANSTAHKDGAGGGGGGANCKFVVSLTKDQTYSYVVGTSGSGGATTMNGEAGWASTFIVGATTYSARGGAGGQAYANGYEGGAGGTASNGATNYTGGKGGNGSEGSGSGGGGGGAGTDGNGNAGAIPAGGAAKASYGGPGADGWDITANQVGRTPSTGYGGGGSGGSRTGAGGAGFAGYIRIEWVDPIAPSAPTIQDATDVLQTTSTVNAKVSDDGGAACEGRFRYRKTGEAGVEDQTTYSGTSGIQPAWRTRVGQKLTISERTVTHLSAYLSKAGSPTGDVVLGIRKVSDDSLIVSKVLFDALELTTSFVWYEAEFDTPVYINEQVRIYVEFNGGDSSNYVWAGFAADDVKESENRVAYLSSWSDTTGEWMYKYTYGHAWTYTDWANGLTTDDPFYADISSLDSDTEYEFQAQLRNEEGESVWSTSEFFTTRSATFTSPFPCFRR